MKGRVLEKIAAVGCALCLAVGVMSGAVFARDEEPAEEELLSPEATFVVVDMELDGEDRATSAEAAGETEAPETTAAAETAAPPLEVTDNRDSVPWYVGDTLAGACPILGGVPWVSAEAFCRALGLNVSASVSGDDFTLTGDVSLEAGAGDIYFVFNGRYILVEDGVVLRDGQALLPVEALAKCLGAAVSWDRVLWTVTVSGGAVSPLVSGDAFYDETDVYWLSRVIYAEAGDQSLLGQIAVGSVVMNRIASDEFPGQDTVYDVIFAKNQFEVVINGMIYMEPSESARIAAKLALEGYDVVRGAKYFAMYDFGEGYECVMWIEDHCFMNEA